MIMRFRPANISLINRRHYLPRLLLILSSKRQKQKPPQRFEDVDRVTPYQLTVSPQPNRNLERSSKRTHRSPLRRKHAPSPAACLPPGPQHKPTRCDLPFAPVGGTIPARNG